MINSTSLDQGIKLPEKYSHLSIKEYLQVLIDYAEKYRKWTDIHIVNFMTMNQKDLIDGDWWKVLNNANSNQEEWVDLIVNITNGSVKKEWPLSLQEFIQETMDIALPRYSSSTIDPIDKRISPGMTSKKIHEVERMSPVIKEMAKKNAISSIVDLGAGQGYLSRTLAFKSNLKVLAVDSSTVQTCGAKRFDEIAAKYIGKDELDLHHVTEMITHENASTILSKWSDSDVQDEKWLLCGLHTCGDLSTMMLRLFISSAEITSLVNIGCCYHFLTNNQDSSCAGFPMSDMVQESGFYLSPPGKMLSCQAPLRWSDKKAETLVAFEHHFFRALLQFIMVEKGLTTVSHAPVVGRLNKKRDFTSFSVYVKAALKRFNLSQDAITSEEAEAYYEKYKNKQVDKEITILWTLRVLLGPILESIILVDRWLYLNDTIPDSATKSVRMWPIFDPLLSPRNVIIAANK